MADFDDYESLSPTASATTHMIAGSLAGVFEHCAMYPADSIKVNTSRLYSCCLNVPFVEYRALVGSAAAAAAPVLACAESSLDRQIFRS